MITNQHVPDWVDRRTAEWCAEICDAVDARLIQINGDHARGARACAAALRMIVAVGKPALPAVIAPQICPNCHLEFRNGDTCPRGKGGCPMGGDF